MNREGLGVGFEVGSRVSALCTVLSRKAAYVVMVREEGGEQPYDNLK